MTLRGSRDPASTRTIKEKNRSWNMALSIGMKASRALRLLLGLRNSRVANALAIYGFTEHDMEEGWALLQALGRMRVDTTFGPSDAGTILKLDPWENHWFPVATATLTRHHPAMHDQVF